MIRLVILLGVALLSQADDLDVITVPRDVLKFIIGCNQGDLTSAYPVPVHKTEISDIDGTTSQHVSLLSLEELRDSLRQSVHNEDVLGHIIKQVEDATKTDKLSTGRSDCTVENHISIAIPPQEMDDFNDRVQMLMQQNSRLLLEQINNLFTYKLVRQKSDAEKLFKRRTNQILQRLNKIMDHLGIPMDQDDGNDDDGHEDDEMPTTVHPDDFFPTWQPQPEPDSESEPEPEPESEPEPEPHATTFRPPSASAEPVTEMFQPMPVTEFQTMTTDGNKSSEEEDDTKIRVASSATDGTKIGEFIRTPQQPPIVFNNGIGLVPSISRQRQRIRPRPSAHSANRYRPILG